MSGNTGEGRGSVNPRDWHVWLAAALLVAAYMIVNLKVNSGKFAMYWGHLAILLGFVAGQTWPKVWRSLRRPG